MKFYYTQWTCPECDHSFNEKNAWIGDEPYPVISWNHCECTGTTCPECGCEFGTGDFMLDVFREGNSQ